MGTGTTVDEVGTKKEGGVAAPVTKGDLLFDGDVTSSMTTMPAAAVPHCTRIC